MATRNGDYFHRGLTFGMLVGLLVALLLAPSSGRELRARLRAHFGGLTSGNGPPDTAPEDAATQSSTL